jgi:xanthine/uracil permease
MTAQEQTGSPSAVKPIYGLEDRPELPRTLLLGAQHVLTMFGATVSVPLLFGPVMGMSAAETARLISIVMLASGVATLLQTTIGTRLPIVQGVSFAFLGTFFLIIGTAAAEAEAAGAPSSSAGWWRRPSGSAASSERCARFCRRSSSVR